MKYSQNVDIWLIMMLILNPDIVKLFQNVNMKTSNNELIPFFKTSLENMVTDEYYIVLKADNIPTDERERCYLIY